MFLVRRPANSSSELSALQSEMNRMFDGVFGPAVSFWPTANQSTVPFPKLDVSETADAVHISAELPGLKQEQIDVEIHADTLRVSGEKKDERVTTEHSFRTVERSFGQFDRTIKLPVEVDAKQADATFKDGVLSITLPKLKPVTPQKIAVKSL